MEQMLRPMPRGPNPREPGQYWGRQIFLDMLGQEMSSLPAIYEVVDGALRGHGLLVKTGDKAKPFATLNCYAWGPPTDGELERLESFAQQMAVVP